MIKIYSNDKMIQNIENESNLFSSDDRKKLKKEFDDLFLTEVKTQANND